MQRNKTLAIGFSVILILSLTIGIFAFAQPQPLQTEPFDFPRLDELWMIEAYPYTVALEKARAGEIDSYLGAIRTEVVDELSAEPYNWQVSMNPGFHMCYAGMNCRDYTPDSSGVYWDNCGRLPGDPLYPMNISQFRYALEIIVGCEKDAWIADIYGYINVRLDTNIPPASAYWYNPYIAPYPEDWAKAVSVLLGAGFTVDDGPDDTLHTNDDIWYMPNGVKLIGGPTSASPGSDRVCGYDEFHDPAMWGIQVVLVGRALAPTSYEIMCRHLEKWNEFFTGVVLDCEVVTTPCGCDPAGCVDGALFHAKECNIFDPLILIPFCNRDHDIYMLCWGLGRTPDYLYDFFHPDMDVECLNNSPGLDHPGLNRLIATIKFWKIKDFEVLAKNVGEWPEGLVIPPCTTYGPFGPFDAPVDKWVQIERCSQELGVYDEELIPGIQENNVWEEIDGRWYLTIHIKEEIILWVGDALEVKFQPCTYHRLITDVDEMRNLAWLAQWKLYYLCPYLPIYSRNYINLYAPGLTGYVESLGYGSAPSTLLMPWTFANLHWDGSPVGGSVNWHVAGDVGTLNPFKVKWVYEVMIANRMYDSLYVVNPYDHSDVPWAAWKWEMIPWDDPAIGVPNGMILKIWLRNDVYWQDGLHVTAEDVKWNFDFIESTQAPEFTAIISPIYVKTEVIEEYTLEIYINATGLWKAYEFLANALLFPKIVWEPWWGDYAGASAWTTWAVDYQAWTGRVPTGSKVPMTCLFGTGPWVLDYWNEVDTAHLYKNTEYWARVNTLSTYTAGGEPGLLAHAGYGSSLVDQLININPDYVIDLPAGNWEYGVQLYGYFQNASHDAVSLDPYTYMNMPIPALPIIPVPGDLGGGLPVKWFNYDGIVEGKDLSLFLMAYRKDPPAPGWGGSQWRRGVYLLINGQVYVWA